MNILTNYQQVKENIQRKAHACGRRSEEITLVVVSKNYPIEHIQSVYQAGERDFGENRIQEVFTKIAYLPSDCRWHLIGNLQSNKITKAISSFQLIHSVDKPELAQKISLASKAKDVTTSILLQVNTSGEKTKHGLTAMEWETSLESINQLHHLHIEGLMTMAPYTEDQQIIRSCFQELYRLRERWRREMKNPQIFQHLSMGMSNDYLIAIEEGATLLRIGTAIFNK